MPPLLPFFFPERSKYSHAQKKKRKTRNEFYVARVAMWTTKKGERERKWEIKVTAWGERKGNKNKNRLHSHTVTNLLESVNGRSWLVKIEPNQQRTPNEFPTELRCRKFANMHRQIARNVQKSVSYVDILIPTELPSCIPPFGDWEWLWVGFFFPRSHLKMFCLLSNNDAHRVRECKSLISTEKSRSLTERQSRCR